MKKFVYNKGNGDVSERTVFVIHPASDCFLCIDLSSYSPEEQETLSKEITKLRNEFNDGIKKLGLAGNWRQFKQEKME